MAQAQTTTYYDQDWEETTKSKASYYRLTTLPTPPDTLIHIQDFYANGTRQSDGYVTTLKYYDNYVGRVNWYYPNGQLEHFTTYHPETLKEFGPAAWYLENGQILAQGAYEYGSASEGIVRNYTYALRFTKVENDQLISRLDYYENSHQIAHEIFYQANNFHIDEEVFYDKKGQEIGRLKYVSGSGFVIDSGVKIEFYRSSKANISIKTIQHFAHKKAEGQQVTYHPNGELWTKGINKNNKHFDGEFIDGYTLKVVKNGQLQKSQQFTKDWKVKATLTYKNNEIWEGIDEAVVVTDVYKNGKRTERITFSHQIKKSFSHIKNMVRTLIKFIGLTKKEKNLE